MASYKVWLINHGLFTPNSYNTLNEAMAAAQATGYQCSIQQFDEDSLAFVEVGQFCPIKGRHINRENLST